MLSPDGVVGCKIKRVESVETEGSQKVLLMLQLCTLNKSTHYAWSDKDNNTCSCACSVILNRFC